MPPSPCFLVDDNAEECDASLNLDALWAAMAGPPRGPAAARWREKGRSLETVRALIDAAAKLIASITPQSAFNKEGQQRRAWLSERGPKAAARDVREERKNTFLREIGRQWRLISNKETCS